MRVFETRRRVRHSAQNMFDLVADVETYPQFVPLCQSLRVRSRRQEGAREVLVADMTVAYKVMRETFTSRVALDRPHLKLLVEYLDGPFRHMENRWTFNEQEEGGCEVHFYLAYEFRSRTLGLVMGSVFDAAFRRFATAFEQRADKVYGAA